MKRSGVARNGLPRAQASAVKARSADNSVLPGAVACTRNPLTQGLYSCVMANTSRALRLAVLIDAENTSARIASRLFEEVARIGDAVVRRIYGDFSGTRLRAWAEVLPAHAIRTQQNFAMTTGKNAADIALVIDAMDLLHTGRFDGFCLVSSDSDFSGLATRMREQGVEVFGFGERKTPEGFRQACRRFIFTESFMAEQPSAGGPAPVLPGMQPNAAVPLIRQAIQELKPQGGWVALGVVGQRLSQLVHDFDPRAYGHAKLSNLLAESGCFEARKKADGGLEVRVRPSSPAGTAHA